MAVAVVKYTDLNSIHRAIEMVDGLAELKPGDKVLIKPNALMGGSPKVSCRGITTSPEVVKGVIQMVKEKGCSDITIAEGAVDIPGLKLDTDAAFVWSGLKALAEEEGVRLVDLNKPPHREVVILGDQEMEIGEAVFDADFVINIPVMKTHAQTRVTLGLKNLKGCLAPESKKKCHIELNLHNAIAEFNTHIPCDLVVLDALTAMETGPTPVKEDSVKEMGLILASKDRLECDVVGSYLLGYEAASVPHIARYAELVGRSADLEKVEVLGEDIDQYRLKLDYYFNWAEHMIENFDIKGLRMPYYGDHLCSACGFNLYAGLLYFCRENRGASFDNVEFCSGLSVRPSKGAKKVALLGKCAVKANKGLKDAIKIGACPPDPKKMAEKLTEALNK